MKTGSFPYLFRIKRSGFHFNRSLDTLFKHCTIFLRTQPLEIVQCLHAILISSLSIVFQEDSCIEGIRRHELSERLYKEPVHHTLGMDPCVGIISQSDGLHRSAEVLRLK